MNDEGFFPLGPTIAPGPPQPTAPVAPKVGGAPGAKHKGGKSKKAAATAAPTAALVGLQENVGTAVPHQPAAARPAPAAASDDEGAAAAGNDMKKGAWTDEEDAALRHYIQVRAGRCAALEGRRDSRAHAAGVGVRAAIAGGPCASTGPRSL